ncbi:LysR family transcriptional regulator [Phenylobacterium sp. LjRoot225]|uniref:LysR family transcriptional regulator n=1 Tax=Phenylobacterium sp. LjRoot225 TaxID=3342285 RepID=UPI003ECFC649
MHIIGAIYTDDVLLDLRSLRHLVVLARHLNYVRAADELGVTQPTLSRSIQALERQLDIRLFDRDRGGVRITPQGRRMADRAAVLLRDADDLEHQAMLAARGEAGRVRFGMAPMPAHTLLSGALTDRLAVAPAVTNEVLVRDVDALWTMLLAGEIEFFVDPNPPTHDLSEVRLEVLGEFPLSVIVRADHPLLREGSTGGRYPLLRSSWTGVAVPEEVTDHILGPPNVIEDFSALASLAAATDALWLSSAFAIQDELRSGSLRELFRAAGHIKITMCSLKRRSLSPAAAAVAAMLRRRVKLIMYDDNSTD